MIEFETATGHHEIWYDSSDISKFLMIKVDNKILGRNKFLQYLRFNGLLMKDSNQPKQQWISNGLARWHTTTKRWKTYGMPIWSERGLRRLQVMIANNELLQGFEKRRGKNVVLLDEIC